MAKFISRVKEAASSEQVRNVVKTTLKVAAAIGGIVLVYKAGYSMGKGAKSLELSDSLCEKAHETFGKHVSVPFSDGSGRIEIEDAFMDVKASDVVRFVKPQDILTLAKEYAAKW